MEAELIREFNHGLDNFCIILLNLDWYNTVQVKLMKAILIKGRSNCLYFIISKAFRFASLHGVEMMK